MKGISVFAPPIKVRYIGPRNASKRLLNKVNAVVEATLPPNNPTTTGADVAVGAKMQIIVA